MALRDGGDGAALLTTTLVDSEILIRPQDGHLPVIVLRLQAGWTHQLAVSHLTPGEALELAAALHHAAVRATGGAQQNH